MHQRIGEPNDTYKERCRIYMQDWRTRNYEREAKKRAEYFQENKKRIYGYRQKSEVIAKKHASDARYAKREAKKIAAYKLRWTNEQYRQDENFRIKTILRSRIHTALKKQGGRKLLRTEQLIGCTIQFLQGYIEARFKDGMDWSNKGKWHIDHITPCSSFDLTKSDQQRKCFHYSNLQPLWGPDNISKSNKIIPFQQAA